MYAAFLLRNISYDTHCLITEVRLLPAWFNGTAVTTKQDRRISRTRRRLTEALVALTLEGGYEEVSIRDLTERAGVGYATFFRHYPAKEALLGDVLETFLDELLSLVGPQTGIDPQTTGRLVFEHAQKNSELYRVLLSSGSSGLLARVHEVGTQGVLDTLTPKEGSPVPVEVAANHLIASFLALIAWWLEQNMPYPPARMGEMYRDLIMEPTKALAFEG